MRARTQGIMYSRQVLYPEPHPTTCFKPCAIFSALIKHSEQAGPGTFTLQ